MSIYFYTFLKFLNKNNIKLFDYQKRLAYTNFINFKNFKNKNYLKLFKSNLNQTNKEKIIFDLINNNDSSLKYYFS